MGILSEQSVDACACVSEKKKKKDIQTPFKKGPVAVRHNVDTYVFVHIKKLSEIGGSMGALYCVENSVWHYVHLL